MANFLLISAIVEVDCTAAHVRHVDDTLAKLSKMMLVKTTMVNLSTRFISTVVHSAFCFFFGFFCYSSIGFLIVTIVRVGIFRLSSRKKEEEMNVSWKSGVLKRGGKKESGKKNKKQEEGKGERKIQGRDAVEEVQGVG